jgi:hypothetical protein
MANGGQVDHRPTGRVLYAASNNGPPTGTGVANPVGDDTPTGHFSRKKPDQRTFSADAPSVRLERRERHPPFEQRRDNRPRVCRIVGEHPSPRCGERDEFFASASQVRRAQAPLRTKRLAPGL